MIALHHSRPICVDVLIRESVGVGVKVCVHESRYIMVHVHDALGFTFRSARVSLASSQSSQVMVGRKLETFSIFTPYYLWKLLRIVELPTSFM